MSTPASERTLRSSGPRHTRALGAALAPTLRAGDVVSLTGELGAGKTCFVQGVAAALGVTARVTSPTFMLVRSYLDVEPPLVHADVYRLDHLSDVLELGDDVFAPDVVTLVEWGDAVASLLPHDRIEVEITGTSPATSGTSATPGSPATSDETERVVRLRGFGSWSTRLDDIAGG